MSQIDITAAECEIVCSILAKHAPDKEVRVFGSRVRGKAKQFSDLDLVIMGETPLPQPVLTAMIDEFRESALPFKVDIVEWTLIKDEFRRVIDDSFVVLRKSNMTGTRS